MTDSNDTTDVPAEILEREAELARLRVEARHAREAASARPMIGTAEWAELMRQLGTRLPLLTDAQLAALDERRDQALWPERLRASGVLPELHDDDVPRILGNRCHPTRPLHVVRKWLATHRRPKPGVSPPSWLFMCGGRGTGKTVAAGWALAQIGGVYVTTQGLLGEYVARSKRRNADGDDPFPVRLERAHFVVLDELGTERDDAADLAREVIFRFVSRRQSRRRMTLVLSNLGADALQRRFAAGVYDERAHDRLRPMWAVVDVGGESLRADRRAGL